MGYANIQADSNFYRQSLNADGVKYVTGPYTSLYEDVFRAVTVTTDSVVSVTSYVGDSLSNQFLLAGTEIYGLFSSVTIHSGKAVLHLAGASYISEIINQYSASGIPLGFYEEGTQCLSQKISALLTQGVFDDASWVMVPSQYKEGTVRAFKPTSELGNLAFTRSSDATYTDAGGLIEKVRTNLMLQSETFDNASWAKTFGASITANTAANPLTGTQTADTIYADATNDFHYISQSITYSAGEATISVYLKANGYSWFVIDSGFPNAFGYFNITTGAVGAKASACTTAITSVGSGWYRCSVTFTATASASTLFLSIRNANNGGSFLGDGVSGFFIYGAQAEMGVATDYIATTSAAVSVGPVANVPRLDYLNSSCPRLLLEGQRTNIIPFSENVTSCLTLQAGTTVTANATTSPDGYQNADLIAFTPNSYRLRGQTVAAATTYTMSVFFKNNTFSGSEFVAFNMSDGVIGGLQAEIQPANGTATFSGAAGAWTGVSGKVENYGNGWYRVSVTGTSVNGGGGWYELASILPTKSAYFWGFSLEIGAYATSYIPTLGAAVTRLADACSKTGISSLIGQTEGTLFYDFVWNGNPVALGDYPVMIYGASYSDFLGLSTYASSPFFFSYIGGSNVVAIAGSTMVVGQRYKMAMAYKLNDYAFYVNGVQVGVDTNAGIPASMANLRTDNPFAGRVASTGVNQALLFPVRLDNATLAALTTL